MALFNAGHAYLQIMPSFKGIDRMMQQQTRKLAAEIDKSLAQGTNDAITRAFRDLDASKVSRAAEKTGDKWSTAFEKQLSKQVKDAADNLPEFNLDKKVKMNKFDRMIVQAQRQLRALSEQKIGPDGDIGLSAVSSQVDALVNKFVKLSDETKNYGQRIRLLRTASQAGIVKDLIDDARAGGLSDGRSYGGAFAAGAKRAIEGALRDLPEVNLDVDASPAERAVAVLRAQLQALGDKKIGIDIDRDRFAEELSYLTGQLETLTRDPKSITLKYDLDKAAQSLRQFGEKVTPLLNEEFGQAGDESGEHFAGAFEDTFRRRLGQAIQQLPSIHMDVDNTDAERKLSAIRVEMEQLFNRRIGVDVDAGSAFAQLSVLLERLRQLDDDDVSIDVRTNAAAAAAELELVAAATNDTDASMLSLANDAGISMSRLGYLVAIGASVGSIVAPAIAAAAVAAAGLGTAVASAAIGFGVFGLGIVGVADAVKKIDAYEQDAAKSAKSLSGAQNQVQNALDGVSGAEQNLRYAREDGARAAADAQERIADAQRSLARTERDVADQIRKSREAQAEAIKAVAQARIDARERIQDAVDNENDAERDLTRANLDQAEARQKLNQALKDAVRDLAELDTAVKRNGLEIDKATTESMKAKEALDKILTNPRATEVERRMAQEAYRERLIQIEELQQKGQELAQQQADAAKNGVDSTSRVKTARDQLANANERAADAERRLSDAREKVTKAQIAGAKTIAEAQKRAADATRSMQEAQADGAERIADAQRSVTQAQRAADVQQRNSQRQISQAQEALAKSQRQLTLAYKGLGVAGGDAFDNMNDSLNQLSPAAQRFARWLYGLKPALQGLRQTAQEGLLPGLQAGIQSLVDTYLPSFDRFVGRIATGLGATVAATAKVFDNPKWHDFFGFLDHEALPSLEGMWVASLNVARGIGNIVVALNPLAKPMGQGLVDLTERFARWSDDLANSSGFIAFMDYAQRVGPKVVRLIEDLAVFVGRLVEAAAPIGEVVLDAAIAVAEWINSWDLDTLAGVVEVVAIIGTGIYLLTGTLRIIKFVTETWTAVSLLAVKAQGLLAVAVARYNTATVGATASTGLLNGRLFATQAAGAAGAAGMSAMTAAAGPLGLAIAGIATVWYLNSLQQAKANEATDELAGAFEELGGAYKTAAEGADQSGSLISDTFRRVAEHNEDLQRTVVTLTGMGASLDDIAGAAGGSAEQLDKVLDLIDRRIEQLKAEKDQHFFDIFDNKERDDEMERLWKLQDRLKESAEQAHLTSDAMKILNQQEQGVARASQLLTPTQQALADAHEVLADKSATAQQKIDALTKAQTVMRQSTIDAIEAQESWEAGLDSLTETVKQNTDAGDKNSKSLSTHTATGRANRDMIENLITSADKMYDADVALNGVTGTAIKKGQDHYKQIQDVAKSLGLSKTATEKLIGAYGKIPKNVETAIGFKEGQFDKMFEQLEQAAFIQEALRKNKDLKTAKAEYKQMISDRHRANAHGWATGGPIEGPGITGGPKDDTNLIWASKGEYMQNADAVDYYGVDFMHALNRKQIPRGMFDGYATGGLIGSKWTFPIDLKKTYIPSLEDLQSAADQAGTGPLGGTAGAGRGWRWQIATLRKMFPGLALFSGYRHSFTANGSLSWHGRDGGRAVDVPPRHDVFNFIHDTYGKGTQELIWLGDKFRNIQHGHHHVYDAHLLSQHGVAGMPNAHIHWAYDKGGMLPPGYSTVFNGTGKPEPVLTGEQWKDLNAVARGSEKSGNQYHFQFRDTTLDPGYLRSLQAREAVLARAGRAH